MTGAVIASSRSQAAMSLPPASSSTSLASATAFMASASSRAGPLTRPSS